MAFCEGFDLGVREAGGAEVIEGVLDERAAQTLIAMAGGDGQVGNVANASGAVLPGGDVADDLAAVFRHKDAGSVAGNVVVNVAGLAPPPIVAIDDAKGLFNAVVDRDAGEAFDCEALQVEKVGGRVRADLHREFLDFRF